MKKQNKQQNYVSQHIKTEQGYRNNILNTMNDMLNRDMDPMNFLLDLKCKMKNQDSKHNSKTPLKKQEQVTYGQLLQKRKNTTSQERQNFKSNMKNATITYNTTKTNSEKKEQSQKDQSHQTTKDQANIYQPQLKDKDAQYNLLAYQYNDLVQKVQTKDQMIYQMQQQLNQMYKNQFHDIDKDQLIQIKQIIDKHYQGIDNENNLNYVDKLKRILDQEENEDQIMSLLIEQKELHVKIEDLIDKNIYLEEELKQNEVLKEQCDKYIQQINDLTELQEGIVKKYEEQLKQYELQILDLRSQVDENVSHSLIEFQMNVQTKPQSLALQDQDLQDIKELFQTFKSQQDSQDMTQENMNALLLQNQNLQYLVNQLNIQQTDNRMKQLCQKFYIKYLRKKMKTISQEIQNQVSK